MSENSKSPRQRSVVCPQCGERVRIPWYWILGIEGIFRCPTCRLPFKTGYKMGAIYSALGLSFSILTIQLIVFLLSIKALIVAIVAVVPLWIFYAYRMRRWQMIRKATRRAEALKKAAAQNPEPPQA